MSPSKIKLSERRPSSGEFIGTIPAHWEEVRIKYLCKTENSGTYGAEIGESEYELPVCTTAHISATGRLLVSDMPIRSFSSDEVTRYLGKPGDIFIVKSSGSNTNIVSGKLALIDTATPQVIFSNFLFRLRPDQNLCSSEFLSLFLQSTITRERIKKMVATTTYPNISVEEYVGKTIPIPSLNEQIRITKFLKDKTDKLDALIAEKQRLLGLLAEKRLTLISRAISQGLNPEMPQRNSSIPWLGNIPENWKTERAKWLFVERDERSELGDEELLSVSHLTGVTSRAEKEVNMFMAESMEGYKRCEAGDLVINTLWAWMGAMGVARKPGIVSPAYNVYRPVDAIDPEYLDLLVRTKRFAEEITRYSKGVWSSRLRLYPEGLYEAWLPVPPKGEQKAIARHVKVATKKIDDFASATERTIALLQERREALITAAVTGRLEIEEAAA